MSIELARAEGGAPHPPRPASAEDAIIPGAVFEAPYPFCWEKASVPGDDPEGPYSVEIMSWRPGVTDENDGCRDRIYANGVGVQILSVAGVYKPGKFPTRVFYTRRWRDPNGREFGKAGLRITTLIAFKRWARGYRHEYEIIAPEAEAA